ELPDGAARARVFHQYWDDKGGKVGEQCSVELCPHHLVGDRLLRMADEHCERDAADWTVAGCGCGRLWVSIAASNRRYLCHADHQHDVHDALIHPTLEFLESSRNYLASHQHVRPVPDPKQLSAKWSSIIHLRIYIPE